jgi:hypothetical protein
MRAVFEEREIGFPGGKPEPGVGRKRVAIPDV